MLYKKELLTVPYIPFKKGKGRPKDGISFYAGATIVELPRSGKVLAVDYYQPGENVPCVRFFADKKNSSFLTYKVSTKEFLKSMLARTLLDINSSYRFIVEESDKARKTAMDYLGIHESSFWSYSINAHSISGLTGVCENFCQKIRDKRNEKALLSHYARQRMYHSQFLDTFDDMEEFNKRAREWNKWTATRFHNERLFFSNLDKKRRRKCYCTACGKRFTSSDNAITHKGQGCCPKCGAAVEYYAERYALSINDKISGKEHGAVFIETNDEYDVWTFCNVWRTYDEKFQPRFHYDDYIRVLKVKKTGKVLSSSYIRAGYYTGPHWTDFKEWAPTYHRVHVCPTNFEQIKEIPAFLFDEVVKSDYPIPIFDLINKAMRYPQVEYLWKMGLTKFVIQSPTLSPFVDYSKRSFSEVMGVTKQYLPMYRELNVDYYEHKIIRSAKEFIHPEDVLAYRALEIREPERYEEAIMSLLGRMTLRKFCNYIQKQFDVRKRQLGVNGLTANNDYRVIIELGDYYQMLIQLGVNLNRKNMFPADIHKSHNRLVERLNAQKKAEKERNEALARAREAKERAEMEERCKILEGYADKSFTVLIPKTKNDFIKEGEELSHCVGRMDGYYRNHIAGTKMIFFIRKLDTPEVAYFTAEIDMSLGTVLQLYGYGDCTAPEDVTLFTKRFAKWVLKQNAKRLRKAG